MKQPAITGLIISAGLSERMGRLKPLISFNNKPFLAHIILKLTNVCQTIVIVTGNKADEIKDEITSWLKENDKAVLKKIKWYHNPDFEKGMLTSLQTGIAELKDFKWVLYHFADQPTLPELFYEQFVKQIDNSYDWIQPGYKNRPGHPILISSTLFKDIIELKPTQSLRDLVKNKNVQRTIWKCDFPEILDDYDTPQQLKKMSID